MCSSKFVLKVLVSRFTNRKGHYNEFMIEEGREEGKKGGRALYLQHFFVIVNKCAGWLNTITCMQYHYLLTIIILIINTL